MDCEVDGFEEDCVFGVGLLDVFVWDGGRDGSCGSGRVRGRLHYCLENLMEQCSDCFIL